MSISIFSTPKLPRGRVVVVQDGMVVADGMLDDLITVDEDPDVHSVIYLHPDDAAEFDAWCREQRNRRLN